MSNIIDDIAQLSEHIGPRPAGTEEEQQAALYIADELQKSAGFSTVIEDFNCLTNGSIAQTICFALGFITALLALIFPIVSIPCFIVGAIVAVLYVLEVLGKDTLSRFFHNGVSQNIVAKYQPVQAKGPGRTRKIILVANYDSEKENKKYQSALAGVLDKVRLTVLAGLIASPLIIFIRMVFFTNASGPASLVLIVLTVICMILMALPLLDALMRQVAPYNQAANNNAAGVGVLLETARTIGNGLVSEEDLEQRAQEEGTTIHGKEAADEAGVLPEGTDVEYEVPEKKLSPEESLAAAKAAIAALTGKPVADQVPMTDIASRLAQAGQPADSEAASVHFAVDESVDQFVAGTEQSGLGASTGQGVAGSSRGVVRERVVVHPTERAATTTSNASDVSGASDVSDTMSMAGVSQDGQVSVADMHGATEEATPHETSSFERVRPEALSSGQTGMGEHISKTPEWAKVAQAKAHANKPSLAEKSPHVARSQFADTPAAQLTEEALLASGQSVRAASATAYKTTEEVTDESAGENHNTTPEEPKSELELRLEALRSEIQAAKPPQVSQEMRDEIAQMSEDDEALASTEESVPSMPDDNTSASVEESAKELASDTSEDALPKATNDAAVAAMAAATLQTATGQPIANTPGSSSEPTQSPASSQAGTSRTKRQRRNPLAELVDKEGFEVAGTTTKMPKILADSMAAGAEAVIPSETPKGAKKTQETKEPVTSTPVPVATSSQEEGATEAIAPIDTTAIDTTATTALQEKAAITDTQSKPAIDAVPATISTPVATATVQETEAAQTPDTKSEPVEAVAPIVGMEDMAPLQSGSIPRIAVDADGNEALSSDEDRPKEKQVIVLPDVATVASVHSEEGKQRAPMAESNESTQSGTRALLSNMLPRIEEVEDSDKTQVLSAASYPQTGGDDGGDVERTAVSTTGSFSTVGTTGSFGAVGDDLVADVAPEDRYIEDADDSDYDQDYTEAGAFTASSYVEMPKSRTHKLFGRFRSKKKQEREELAEQSMTDWIDADEDYNARSVGKARGSWESFREDDFYEEPPAGSAQYESADQGNEYQQDEYQQDEFYEPEVNDENRDWNGGAFSLSGLRKNKGKKNRDKKDEFYDDEFYEDEEYEEVIERPVGSADATGRMPVMKSSVSGKQDAERINKELKKLRNFRFPGIDTEVWFVALGAEYANHSGIQAFMEEHAAELRGALIVNLEALGTGNLTLVEKEGLLRTKTVSSRIKRIFNTASERSGIGYDVTTLKSRDTTSLYVMNHGHQAVTLAGMEHGQTAWFGSPDDTIDNIDEDILNENVSFVMSILKNI